MLLICQGLTIASRLFKKVLNEKYNNQERISVYVKQLDTDRVAAINDEKSMYAASVAKLGVLYYAQERLSQKKIIIIR